MTALPTPRTQLISRSTSWVTSASMAAKRRKRAKSALPPRRDFHRLDNFRIGGAAAEIAREIMNDVVVARVGMFLQQLMHHEHESRCAEAALERATVDERLLHDRQRAIGIERFDRGDALAVDPGREIKAARHRLVVDQHGAAAAQALAAAFARAEQAEALQQLDQVAMRLDVGRNRLAVEREIDAVHAHHSSSSGSPACARKARRTASAVIGSSVMRTPTASWMALAMAGETPKVPDSPSPLAPNGPECCSASTKMFSIGGMSRMPGIL